MNLPPHSFCDPIRLADALDGLRAGPGWPGDVLLHAEPRVGDGAGEGEGGYTQHPFLLLPLSPGLRTFREAAAGGWRAVSPMEAVLFRADSWVWTRKSTPCRLLRLTFHPDCLVAGRRREGTSKLHALRVIRHPPTRLMEELLVRMQDPGMAGEDRARALHLLLAEAAAMLRAAPGGDATEPFDRYLLAEQFLREHLDRPLTRQDCATALGLSPTHLSRLFQKFGDCSFQKTLERFRLERARALLRHSSLPVADIAAASGFGSDAYFIRVFRERCGKTPGQWRAAASE